MAGVFDRDGAVAGIKTGPVVIGAKSAVAIVLGLNRTADWARARGGVSSTRVPLDREPTAEVRPAALEIFSGDYTDGERMRHIARRGDRLVYSRAPGDELELLPIGPSTFRFGRTTFFSFDPGGASVTIRDGCGSILSTLQRVVPQHLPNGKE